MLVIAGGSQNLPGAVEQAEAVYRDAAAEFPVTGTLIARQVRHFAASVRLGRDEPQAMRRLDEVSGGLGDAESLSSLLPRILDGAVWLMGADFGTVQLLDPVTGSLRLVTQSGFDAGFTEYFAVVDDGHSAPGRAARQSAQVVIADVNADRGFAPHRAIAAAAGFCAVQSTPLADRAGHLVGMVSTYARRPHRPPGLDLRIMELYADAAGEAIAAHLAVVGDNGQGHPIGRAVIPPRLDPGNDQVPGLASHERGLAREAASLDDRMAHFAGYIVNRLFFVGLSLDSAHSIVGKGPAGDRLAAATDEVDRLIRVIRDQLFQPDDQERPPQTADRAALLQEHLARTARALRASAATYAALLERKAAIARQPQRMDYPTEIKRWRAFADQAEQMAERWEQSPLPGSDRRPANIGLSPRPGGRNVTSRRDLRPWRQAERRADSRVLGAHKPQGTPELALRDFQGGGDRDARRSRRRDRSQGPSCWR